MIFCEKKVWKNSENYYNSLNSESETTSRPQLNTRSDRRGSRLLVCLHVISDVSELSHITQWQYFNSLIQGDASNVL